MFLFFRQVIYNDNLTNMLNVLYINY